MAILKAPLVSVIIPSFHSGSKLIRCVDSLMKQDADFVYEVIVVKSGEASDESLSCRFPTVKFLECPQRLLPGEARNLGAARSNATYYLFLDSDCIAPSNWLRAWGDLLQASEGLVGGAVLPAVESSALQRADFLLTFGEFLPSRPRKSVRFVPSCHMGCSAKVFWAVGGFPEKLAASEDVLFCYRAQEKFRVEFEPSVSVFHESRATLKSFLAHHLHLGNYSARVRKISRVSGYWLSKISPLAFLAPIIRWSRVVFRLNDQLTPLSLLLISGGVATWGAGFIWGACSFTPEKNHK
jgi:GT2 family glycosyltransferase